MASPTIHSGARGGYSGGIHSLFYVGQGAPFVCKEKIVLLDGNFL
jgi:hypothetical protein